MTRALGHGPDDDADELVRNVGGDILRVPIRTIQYLLENRDLVLALERPRSGEVLVQNDAQGVDVAATIGLLAVRLLGRHVTALPDEISTFVGLLGTAH